MNLHLQTLIGRFEAGGGLLKYSVGGLTAEQVKSRPGPGAWSIAELTAHMADSDLVATDRMKRVIAEENPTLLAYDENAWIEKLRSNDMPVDESAILFDTNRRWVTRILRNCSEQDFARFGNHSEKGRMTLAELLTTYVNHLDHHLKFVYAKRANLGVTIQPRYSDEPL
jgi:uncharacterized damage-inducible protein DinB